MIDIYILFLILVILAMLAEWIEGRKEKRNKTDQQAKASFQENIIKKGNEK